MTVQSKLLTVLLENLYELKRNCANSGSSFVATSNHFKNYSMMPVSTRLLQYNYCKMSEIVPATVTKLKLVQSILMNIFTEVAAMVASLVYSYAPSIM